MKTPRTILWCGAICALAAGMSAQAAVPTSRTAVTPGIINYQGRLTNAEGNPYTNGVYTIEFRIYDDATATGAGVWGCSYSVYVKEGYFNVMLGAPGGAAISPAPTYGQSDLWKALWYDTASAAKANDRYLALKVTSGPDSSLPDPPAEAFPRQRLLSAPFAERAQMAQYARAAVDTFVVPSTLTASGAVTVVGGLTVRSSSSLTNTTVTGSLTVNGPLTANNSEAIFNKGATVNGGMTYAKQGLEVSGGAATLKGGAAVQGNLSVTSGVTKAQGGLEVSGGALNLLNNLNVAGSKAIVVRQYYAPNTEDYIWNTAYPTATWSAMVVGFDFGWCDIDENDSEDSFRARAEKGTDGYWKVHFRGHYHENYADPTIDVMFIRRELVDDNR